MPSYEKKPASLRERERFARKKKDRKKRPGTNGQRTDVLFHRKATISGYEATTKKNENDAYFPEKGQRVGLPDEDQQRSQEERRGTGPFRPGKKEKKESQSISIEGKGAATALPKDAEPSPRGTKDPSPIKKRGRNADTAQTVGEGRRPPTFYLW